jgi:membrane protease YdiL (CAAX protease family)
MKTTTSAWNSFTAGFGIIGPLLLICGGWVSGALILGLAPKPIGGLAALGVGISFVLLYGLWGRGGNLRPRAQVRLGPVRGNRRQLGATFAAFGVFDAGFLCLMERLDGAGARAPGLFDQTSIVAIVLVGPLIEEVVFRGWMLRRLELRFGRATSAVVTAALFAAMHLQLVLSPQRFVFGIVAAASVYLTRSLWPAIGLHVVRNGIIVALARGGVEMHPALQGPAALIAITLALVAGMLGLTVVLWRASALRRAGARVATAAPA